MNRTQKHGPILSQDTIYARLFGRKRQWEIGRAPQIATRTVRPKLRRNSAGNREGTQNVN